MGLHAQCFVFVIVVGVFVAIISLIVSARDKGVIDLYSDAANVVF